MGKRGRQRVKSPPGRVKKRDRMARVQVSDEVWSAFRVGLGPTPVSIALGELVEREVGRQRRRSAGDPETARLAIEDARSVAQELASLIDRFEPMTEPVRDEGRGAAAARAPTKNDRERQARLANL
jgi:hypothetical protein